MPTDTYSISDLARLTGVNVRTIRYYLAQGLLPASGESGPGAHYGEGHLDRLRLTRRLQQQHLPLAEIRRRLSELTDAEAASVLATTQAPEASPTTSALDYVRSVLEASSSSEPPSAPTPAIKPTTPATRPTTLAASPALARLLKAGPPAPSLAAGYAAIGMLSEESETHHPPVAIAKAPQALPPMPAGPEPATPERSQWERLSLGPNIELHIRRPLGRLEQRRVERLLTIARQVLKEEKP